ncbi:capsular biosynthesis protein [Bacillus sp. FJAT-27225]|uniref:CpsD/CapB family tyrosine-protein kinase n=1 Tax=Bacillus sp. FJAT-27225 TaxID=1743144 RepID=UPI00080C292C|nr:CpsD/CapB family tyrosine-protein kinase [Bacillus sp. FJAT-27225]OCA87897.1 capsular biosynthesis protein [Bacillus sp. FJAT-27225]
MALNRRKKPQTGDKRVKLVTLFDPKSTISEQYRTIRTNIQFSSVDREIRSLMITSSGPAEGKSTTAANMAVVFAQTGKKVLLIDSDLRRPTVHYTFSLPNTYGLTNVLTKQIQFEEAIRETEVENLFIMTSGPIPPNPAELLGAATMNQLFETAYSHFDIVLFDTPPVLAVTDAQILANKCDGTLLVIYSGKTIIEQVTKAKELLEAAQGKLLGTVLNHKEIKGNDYYYYQYYGGK